MPKAQNAFLPQTSVFGRYAYIKSHITYCGEGQMGNRLLASRLYSWPFDAVRCIGSGSVLHRLLQRVASVIAAHSVGQGREVGKTEKPASPGEGESRLLMACVQAGYCGAAYLFRKRSPVCLIIWWR